MSGHCSRPAFSRICLPLCAMLLLAACASGGATGPGLSQPAAVTSADAVDTGTFPNLNIPPRVAAEQISEAERKASVEDLTGVRESQPKITARASDDSAELRKLGRTHARDTLKAIQKAD